LTALREHSWRQEVRGATRGILEYGRMRHAEGEEPGGFEGIQVDDAGWPWEGC
jgi:hypothetical protein